MKKYIFALIILLFLSCLDSAAASIIKNAPYPEVLTENYPQFEEIYRIRIFNVKNGSIEVSENTGSSWQNIGRVIFPVDRVNNKGYTASKWAKNSSVAATAANSIHIKTDYNSKDDRGVIFSIVPFDLLEIPPFYNSFISPDSSIYTDIPAGTGIFGGGYAPFVGNSVYLLNSTNNRIFKIAKGYVPKVGDILVLKVEKPDPYPSCITFENRFGGLITITYGENEERVIGEVLKPVFGVGRFSGTQFTEAGRLRANHSGVIDISTSPMGEIGGFQIIPANHGMSPEMTNARILTQWMVISSPSVQDPSLEGVAPFFLYYLNPNYTKMDVDDPDWISKLMKRTLIEVKVKGSDCWQPMPTISLTRYMRRELPPWANSALLKITHIRIWMPVFNFIYE